MPTGTRGQPGRSKVLSLLMRLGTQRGGVLRFAAGFSVPFGGNLRERDVRIVKIGRKISGGFRSAEGAGHFPAFRSYLSTAARACWPPVSAPA
jgi:transposase